MEKVYRSPKNTMPILGAEFPLISKDSFQKSILKPMYILIFKTAILKIPHRNKQILSYRQLFVVHSDKFEYKVIASKTK